MDKSPCLVFKCTEDSGRMVNVRPINAEGNMGVAVCPEHGREIKKYPDEWNYIKTIDSDYPSGFAMSIQKATIEYPRYLDNLSSSEILSHKPGVRAITTDITDNSKVEHYGPALEAFKVDEKEDKVWTYVLGDKSKTGYFFKRDLILA